MFECEICEYNTERSVDFDRHKKSKRHLKNEQIMNMIISDESIEAKSMIYGRFVCEECHKIYSTKTNLYRHKRCNCSSIKHKFMPNNDKSTYEELYQKIKKLEDKNEQLTNLLCKNSDVVAKTTELALQNSKTAQKSVRGITYAMKHLNNAHQLKLLENKEAVKLLTYDNKKSTNDTVETIIIKYKNKLLDQYLGDILVGAYKKDDPEIQSVWGVDSTRLHFILKQKEWTSDNCGIKLTEIIINPLLKSVEKMIKKYCEKDKPIESQDDDGVLIDNFPKKWGLCQELLIDISKNKLHKQILKYISSRLKLTYDVPTIKQLDE